MASYLNPGTELFRQAINSQIYVDKTGFIQYTNQCLCTENGFLAVSRPRRFGKTIAMNMLNAYYGKNCDSRELFSKFQIAKDESFEKHLNKYNVIKINIRDLISKADTFDGMLEKLTKRIVFEIEEEYPEVRLFDETDLIQSIEDVYNKTKNPFVILIDEWDAVVELMAGRKVIVDTRSFANDMVTFATKDDVLTLLIHLGYLTYDFDTAEAWIPNQENMGEFATTLKVLGWSEVSDFPISVFFREKVCQTQL